MCFFFSLSSPIRLMRVVLLFFGLAIEGPPLAHQGMRSNFMFVLLRWGVFYHHIHIYNVPIEQQQPFIQFLNNNARYYCISIILNNLTVIYRMRK